MTAPTAIYDDQCAFCRASADLMRRRSRPGVLRVLPWSDDEALELLSWHGVDTDARESFVLVVGDKCYEHSDAIFESARYLRAPWRWSRLFQILPRALRDRVYGVISRNRHRLICDDDACHRHRH